MQIAWIILCHVLVISFVKNPASISGQFRASIREQSIPSRNIWNFIITAPKKELRSTIGRYDTTSLLIFYICCERRVWIKTQRVLCEDCIILAKQSLEKVAKMIIDYFKNSFYSSLTLSFIGMS